LVYYATFHNVPIPYTTFLVFYKHISFYNHVYNCLLQEDVFFDTYDWVKELCETIEEIKNGDVVANVYLCKNGEYYAF